MRLLVAEDDPMLLKSILYIFEKNKFVADGVSNGSDALEYALSNNYDGLILDIMMPEKDGLEVVATLREMGVSTPVLFLTARTEVSQRVEGLDAGADDYLTKPFAAPELLARTRAMLRRKDNYVPELMEYNDVTLNRSTYQLIYREHLHALRGREFQLMEILMQRPNMIIPTEHFITHVWGWDTNVEISVVWVHMSNLRKKLKEMNAPLSIRFVRNAGYVLEAAREPL
ncbi:MAG: response regulator transcription factor [Bacillota bacterium]|nr:response regulator transcription factor [Bacillota bacterium]